MHILIIPSEEFVPAYAPLAGIFQYHQAMILKEAGHKVGVISIGQSFTIPMIIKGLALKCLGKKAGNLADDYSSRQLVKLGYRKIFKIAKYLARYTKDDIPVYKIEGFYFFRQKENKNHFGWIKAGLAAFKNYYKDEGMPDIVHAHNAIYAGMLAQKIKEKYGIPYVITEHSTAFAQKKIEDKGLIKRMYSAYQSSKGLFAVSRPFCELLNRTFGFNEFKCLYNVLDPYLEKQSDQTLWKKEPEFTFLNIAHLHPKKDHQTLIKAFKKVSTQSTRTKLWIGGSGELDRELKEMVRAEGLEQKIFFLGELNRDAVIQYLLAADCFVLSSKIETFGVVVIEAMLFGKPVIATRCGGPEDFITEKTGIVVEKQNIEQLADAMLQMINLSEQYQPDAIREYTIACFGKDKFLRNIKSIYKAAV